MMQPVIHLALKSYMESFVHVHGCILTNLACNAALAGLLNNLNSKSQTMHHLIHHLVHRKILPNARTYTPQMWRQYIRSRVCVM